MTGKEMHCMQPAESKLVVEKRVVVMVLCTVSTCM